jgi:hypothetical protein
MNDADFQDALSNSLLTASDGLSLATNAVATAIIGYVYW